MQKNDTKAKANKVKGKKIRSPPSNDTKGMRPGSKNCT